MNETAVVPFYFQEHEVRTITIANEPWFVAKDVCDILELTNPTESLKSLDDDELTSEKLRSGGQEREMNLISESGLYTLIIRSNKPQAKLFRKWVTADVLPSIRKTGGYGLAVGGDMVPVNRQYFESLRENNTLLAENSRLLKQLLNNELNRKPQRKNFTPEEDELVLQMRSRGLSHREIGLELARVPSSIRSCLRRLGVAGEV